MIRKAGKLVKVLLSLDFKSSIIFDYIFQIVKELVENSEIDYFLMNLILIQLLKISPYENDSNLTPQYLELMTICFTKMSQLETKTQQCTDFPQLVSGLFGKIFALFDCSRTIKPIILSKATILLSSLLTSCVDNKMLDYAVTSSLAELNVMLQLVENSLGNIGFRDNWGYILILSSSVFEV
jgi:hypothetical protein